MPPVRLVDLVGRLSLAFDLAVDAPPGAVVRATVLAMELGKRAGASDDELRDSFWLRLLPGTSENALFACRLRSVTSDFEQARPRAAGESGALPLRLHRLARSVERALHRDGRLVALDVIRRDGVDAVDQRLVRLFCEESAALFDASEDPGIFERLLALEPAPQQWVDEQRIDEVARSLAVAVDLANPIFRGHSLGVAQLAERAARELGIGADETRTLRLAALLHDLGRVSVPNGVWARPGPLDWSAWERVRLHPYHTARVLGGSAAFTEIAEVASAAHERLDGSGYPQRRTTRALSIPARLLAVAHTAFAMSEERPHRPALSTDAVARELLAEAAAGRLDARVTDAVLSALGVHVRAGPVGMHRLSGRELEVSHFVARGKSDKEIAVDLGISPRTVQVHVARILHKLGVPNRATAAVWLIEHDLAS